MRPLLLTALILSLALGVPARAAPFSENALACDAHISWMAARSSNPDLIHGLERYAAAFRVAAGAQAAAEGRADADAYLSRVTAAKRAEWADHGAFWTTSEAFRDWSSYCRKFAPQLGIDPKAYRPRD